MNFFIIFVMLITLPLDLFKNIYQIPPKPDVSILLDLGSKPSGVGGDLNLSKKCTKCKTIKLLSEYTRNKNNKDGRHTSCSECNRKQVKEFRILNKEHYTNQDKKYYLKTKKEKPHLIINKSKRYRLKHKEKIHYYGKEYHKKRIKTDFLYKLKITLRGRTNSIFKSFKICKKTKTEKLLGTDWFTVKKSIENKFKTGMTWENHGKWEIDHIIPLSSAKNEDELIKLCRYTNLQPLWASENRIKSNKILKENSYL